MAGRAVGTRAAGAGLLGSLPGPVMGLEVLSLYNRRRGSPRRLHDGAPGLGAGLAVRVGSGPGNTSPVAKGKSVRRDAASGPSRAPPTGVPRAC